jgi:DNA polymerase III subunit gamma/tau
VTELSAHFLRIAEREGVRIAPEAVTLIARAADGSVRDGLSLLDQAIAQAEPGVEIAAASVAGMLGLADREAVFDLFEALIGGKPAAALAITDRAHEHGADLGVILQDLLDLVHTVTRLKAVPALRDSTDLPEAERARGGALAEKLSMATIGRAWQMLLKGVGEVEAAPDRRAAAEMVLIRLCYLAEVPPPGELVRRLTEGGATVAPVPAPAPSGGGGGTRAVANGPPVPMAAEAPRQAPSPRNFRDVVALAAGREPMLHSHLLHSVHLVRFAPPVIELRPQPDAPRDLAARLAAVLLEVTETRWTIALSAAPGEPTVAEQGVAADNERRSNAADHPLVRAVLAAFPGARIEAVHDARVDAYGLTPEPALAGEAEPDMPEFVPPDSEFADDESETGDALP